MRAGYLDALRGMAVIWMIIFHAAYDMTLLGFIRLDFNLGFWYAFPRVIAFTFLFCVGISLVFAHTPHIRWEALKKRSLKLFLGALAVSIGTYFLFPQQWIYFGTLHCILTGSLLGALIVNHRRAVWTLLILILLGQYAWGYDIKWLSSILQKPSMDFIPIYPWFWAILLGIVVAPGLNQNHWLMNFPTPKLLTQLGKHSLKIYLLHQPVIFGVLWLIKALV